MKWAISSYNYSTEQREIFFEFRTKKEAQGMANSINDANKTHNDPEKKAYVIKRN